jgi:signal transduction histidine kinase
VSIETSEINQGSELPLGRQAPALDKGPGRAGEHEDFPLDLQPTTLSALCRSALDDVGSRFPGRVVEYAPDVAERGGAGEWDPRRIAYALTILLEDALKRSRAESPVSLRWREHDDVVVVRIQFARPLERGDGFVTYFERGVRPDGADDAVGTLRIAVARKILLQHRGELARIRTRAGTTYVATLPRRAADVLTDALPDGDVA